VTSTLAEVLAGAERHVAAERIDRVWVFPPMGQGGRETGLVVFALFPLEDDEESRFQRRDVHLLRYRAESDRGKVTREESFTREALAPLERLPAVIAGVRRRLKDAAGDEDPLEHAIGGDGAAWDALTESAMAAAVLDEASGE